MFKQCSDYIQVTIILRHAVWKQLSYDFVSTATGYFKGHPAEVYLF